MIVLSVCPSIFELYLSESYHYVFISKVILVNVISMKIVSIFSYFGKISRVRNFLGFYISFVCDFYFLPDCQYCHTQFNFMNILIKAEKITYENEYKHYQYDHFC